MNTLPVYYNENEKFTAQWLRNLIAAGHLPAGDVDERSIVDVQPDDLAGYRQCHFFAGIGGWALAARLAGWPDDRELWTGSCPCQPFSVAGKGAGADDERHLWPHQFRLLRARRPAVWMGEQVAAAVGKGWLDGVLADLEGIGYACGSAVVPACAVNAPHRRDRLWIVAEHRGGLVEHADQSSTGEERQQRGWQFSRTGCDPEACGSGDVADSNGIAGGQGCTLDCGSDQGSGALTRPGFVGGRGDSAWGDHAWIVGHDGKARRVPVAESGIRLLAHGVPARVGKLRAYGNAIVPSLAAEVILGYLRSEEGGAYVSAD